MFNYMVINMANRMAIDMVIQLIDMVFNLEPLLIAWLLISFLVWLIKWLLL